MLTLCAEADGQAAWRQTKICPAGFVSFIGNKRSKANLNIPCTGKFTGKSLIKGMSISGYDTYKGYWLTYSPTATVSFHNTWTLSEQQFSTLMGLTVEPTNDTAEVEQFIKNFKLE